MGSLGSLGSQPRKRGAGILFFGPEIPSFSNQSLLELGSALREQQWASGIPHMLLSAWDTISTKIPSLSSVPGRQQLTDLNTWLQEGPPEKDVGDLPNVVLAPLTVLTQLTQFRRYADYYPNSERGTLDDLIREGDIHPLGFCMGLLSALVAFNSAGADLWYHHVGVAVRLTVLVGAVVDAADITHPKGASESIAVSWQDSNQRGDLKRILEQFPEDAYISVHYDERRSTVTISKQAAPQLLQELRKVGVTAVPTGLRGRFHSKQHSEIMSKLLRLCRSNLGWQFKYPDTEIDTDDHEAALRALLVDECDWYRTVSMLVKDQAGSKGRLTSISFGQGRYISPSLQSKFDNRIEQLMPSEAQASSSYHPVVNPQSNENEIPSTKNGTPPHDSNITRNDDMDDSRDIAIVGMSIKVAGADDLPEFSAILRAGESQHQEVPAERVSFGNSPWRRGEESDGRKWYGNFIRDVDAFDHRFFRKSPRESAAMDPQQRLVLQAAYQAVEQSGYFYPTTIPSRDKHIGVYLGTCATEYEHNAACHTAGAFTVMGLLRGSIAGRISHYFGWTGPSMTFDTACSGSAVAIHSAVQALRSGECSAALCGGVNIITNEVWFHNLAGASFLSPTGQCKPFDEAADGYCRGEGIGCVFLKPMAAALADGDQIFGRIAGTAVYQNSNETPLFVPHAPSMSQLFRDVIRQAQLEPKDISLVEAHGTGTPVGDPAEYESVRAALGGTIQRRPLPIGSVKGLVGHTESTSGVVSLIKVILMMNEGFIPPQASYSKMSHRIHASDSDMIHVPTSLLPWEEDCKAALINNYGASGSIAAMVVKQAPRRSQENSTCLSNNTSFPFWIAGFDGRNIEKYCANLAAFVKRKSSSITLADISFNVNRHSNITLPRALHFRCSSVAGLLEQLSPVATSKTVQVKAPRPVILCFGGQISTSVGLDRVVYENVPLIRYHLNECNAIIQSLGYNSIFPDILAKRPIPDPIHLQTMLFALQYACARCWIDCGVRVEAVVGHSFGEITALCIAGVLKLRGAIKLVAGRAEVIRNLWGRDRGVMVAVDGELKLVEKLLAEANRSQKSGSAASIACYNGPQSFTLAGSTLAMETAFDIISNNSDYASIKSKKLNVTNAFHSVLVEPLIPNLEQVGMDLEFHSPTIRIESATEIPSNNEHFTTKFVADHMRNPVFFHHAVQRLAKDYPSAIWLEAGSASKITSMARRTVKPNLNSHFQGVSLTEDRGVDSLTDATLSLWKEGLRVNFWPHHGAEAARNHAVLLLPQYQFEKTGHWLDLKELPPPVAQEGIPQRHDPSLGLWTFVGYQDTNKRRALFRINTESEKYQALVSGHIAVQTAPICPATLEYSMVIEALLSIQDSTMARDQDFHPVIRDMHNDAPLCLNASQAAWMELHEDDDLSHQHWSWKIVTLPVGQQPDSRKNNNATICVQGRIELRPPGEDAEFARYERLVTHRQCISLLDDNAQADDVLQGRNIYRSLSDVVEYGNVYRGVRRVVGRENECAGIVQDPTTYATEAEKNWLDDIPVTDSFSQVAGVWVNCMTDREPNGSDIFLATGCETLMRRPGLARKDRRCEPGKIWHVWARHHRESEKVYLTDVFVFDATDGRLSEVMLGIRYTRIPRISMSRLLVRLTDIPTLKSGTTTMVKANAIHTPQSSPTSYPSTSHHQEVKAKTSGFSRSELSQKVKDIITNVSGVDASEIKEDSELADLGIDSLAGTELAREIESVFRYKIDTLELLFKATSFREFVACISRTVHGPESDAHLEGGDDDGNSVSPSNGGGLLSDESGDTSTILTPTADDASSMDEQENDAAIESLIERINNPEDGDHSSLSQLDILTAFARVKASTDQRIRDNKVDNTDAIIVSRSNRLCVALIVEAFEQLGCPLQTATIGQILPLVKHTPQTSRLVDWLYNFLEKDARLIDRRDARITRTGISTPRKTSEVIFQELLQMNDQWIMAHKLAFYAGKSLTNVLRGRKTGIQALFGSSEGRDLVRGLYYDLPFNRLFYEQMRDTIQLVVDNLASDFHGPLRILEMGAGTGGTTHILAPFLDGLDISIEYTVTDLAPSMVTQARRSFGARYPFMRFAVHDIEQPPAESLRGTQHIVIASNAVHATDDLKAAASNIHMALRSDGMLLLTEMTEGLPFVDLVFGLLDDWWRFADDRVHAIVPAEHWETQLRHAGFGHVDWTDGNLSENRIQKVIIALVSEGSKGKQSVPPMIPQPVSSHNDDNAASREQEAEKFITRYSAGFMASVDKPWCIPNNVEKHEDNGGAVVIITGATGSLGTHLVARFAEDPDVSAVVCLNRRSNLENSTPCRQSEALASRGISLSSEASSKLRILETDITQSQLGLPSAEYAWLVSRGTHILHNGWPMSASRPLCAFEPQFQSLRNLLDLAADISTHRKQNHKAKRVCFQFVSSIGVVGRHLTHNTCIVPEERVSMSSVLPIGYCEAKWTCERLLDETLHRYPESFQAMVIRPGQIAGSTTTGIWNPVEHFSFLVRSAQSLRAFPALDGRLQWVPVDGVAATIADLAINCKANDPVYHIDNPVNQPWEEMVGVLAEELGIPNENIMPFSEWIRKVRRSPLVMETENPALRVANFLEKYFMHMSCGGIILGTDKTVQLSLTLAAQGPVSTDTVRRYLGAWKKMGFLGCP
ncbi:uncharacterized protein GGS22DRAFT_200013 [Annulohypoxylon maeteangense]|uniref:uncharacterized protein n=1 Tax=Annulohypoxylon maeteangense TaxID=1927788 RepID=UPI002007A364|nr:uncharacterized protein GGS22DRAFT_200013 [Annulohypoxylon maeteangense]KAI0885860.1 hypothetical protein GGS22DRAFT_200013 [Annulohypoxylon maeteangense]